MKDINYIIRNPEIPKEFENYYNLRWEILRKPLGGSLYSSIDEYEFNSFHLFVTVKHSQVIAVGRIHEIGDNKSQIRYMAVKKEYQSMRIGSKILLNLEKKAIRNKNEYIVLHARENAVNFYENNNYKICNKSHLLYGKIQHYLMIKSLNI